VNLVARNVSLGQPLPANGSIELAFDRLLLPSSVVRQTFVLTDLAGGSLQPHPIYDPVTRVVTITPLGDLPLVVQHTYRLAIVTPQGPTDPFGLRAIDGATLAPTSPSVIEFPVVAATGTSQPAPPAVDFCGEVWPVLSGKCTGSGCHGGGASAFTGEASPAAGLLLDTPAHIAATAIGRVAHGANTGPRSVAEAPGLRFGVDMPIVDPGSGGPAGNPGDSWMMYKLLLAVPQAAPGAGASDAGVADAYAGLGWRPLSDTERATLSNFVLGREMPFPPAPDAGAKTALTLDELERVSLWIAEGAPIPGQCP
jgi:hypothetical protein